VIAQNKADSERVFSMCRKIDMLDHSLANTLSTLFCHAKSTWPHTHCVWLKCTTRAVLCISARQRSAEICGRAPVMMMMIDVFWSLDAHGRLNGLSQR